ncbi:MAG: FMN-binding protein, partial [Proteobacteria bacterium]|nr:FMN-binding protein [Pseudomonadota bacterium]
QFNSAKLEAGKSYSLDKNIDGITGATLSVRALKKIATLALYCDRQTRPLSK